MYFPSRLHSHYSLLMSTVKQEDLAEYVKKYKYPAVGITDFTNLSGIVSLYKTCKEAKIKPILGVELVVSDNPSLETYTITLLCKNLEGWKTLVNIVSKSNDTENFKKVPTISINSLKDLDTKNLICIDGYVGSFLHNILSNEFNQSFFENDLEELTQNCLNRFWLEDGLKHCSEMLRIFPDYYLEYSEDDVSINILLKDCIKNISSRLNIDILIDNPVYYCDNVGALDQRVLLASHLKCTLRNLDVKIKNGSGIDVRLNMFLNSTQFKFKEHKQSSHKKLYDSCDDYDILSQPKLPHFKCPNDISEIEYLKSLCRTGWRNKLKSSGVLNSKEKEDEYRDRVIFELDVIERANLAGYFLIVQDYVNHFRKQGVLVGCGRGSAGGCLISYLLGITLIDPIPYGLLFSRFFNAGRITPGKISLPDIDVDFPPDVRDDVILYLKNKYGHDNVAQIITLGRLQGRSALKEVLRINEYCSFEEMNIITSKLPPEASISDMLEDMEEPSSIRWALEHQPDELASFCYIKDGELCGDYARAFAQAMRLEGINKNLGKHACAVIISGERLDNYCPMISVSRSKEKLIGVDMYDVEDLGGVKADILGLSLLQKIDRTCKD